MADAVGTPRPAAFALLATLNTAGYRYGSRWRSTSPSILRQLDGQLFPRDSALLDVQSRLLLFDDLLARATQVIPASLEVVLCLYLLTLVLFICRAGRVADRLLVSRWPSAAFVAVSPSPSHHDRRQQLEGSFHPRHLH